MKFEAKKIDLDLDLPTNDGKEVHIAYNGVMTPRKATETMRAMNDYEQRVNKGLTNSQKAAAVHEINAAELALVYPEYTADWFLDNIDPMVLREVVAYVGQQLVGVKKTDL